MVVFLLGNSETQQLLNLQPMTETGERQRVRTHLVSCPVSLWHLFCLWNIFKLKTLFKTIYFNAFKSRCGPVWGTNNTRATVYTIFYLPWNTGRQACSTSGFHVSDHTLCPLRLVMFSFLFNCLYNQVFSSLSFKSSWKYVFCHQTDLKSSLEFEHHSAFYTVDQSGSPPCVGKEDIKTSAFKCRLLQHHLFLSLSSFLPHILVVFVKRNWCQRP